jgi:hypothetical protein
VRRVVNRLVVALLLAALAAFAILVAVEAGARLAGDDTQLSGIDYRSWWTSISDWEPSRALALTILIALAVVGLLIVLAELRPRRPERTVEIGRSSHGPVLLRARAVRPYLRDRLADRDYVQASAPRVRISGTAATVRDRPRTTRPWDDAELQDTRTAITQDLRRLGLEAETVEIEPRPPQGRGTRRVS